MNNDPSSVKQRRGINWVAIIVLCPIGYVLSSGPVLAIGFMLHEATDWEGFYAVMWLYYPLLVWGHNTPLMSYIEWWVVDVFGTVGPG